MRVQQFRCDACDVSFDKAECTLMDTPDARFDLCPACTKIMLLSLEGRRGERAALDAAIATIPRAGEFPNLCISDNVFAAP